MSRYFSPMDFSEEESPKAINPPSDLITSDLTEIYKKISEEISKLKSGTSKFRKHAVHFPKGRSPVNGALERFKKHPTRSNLGLFLTLAEQDLGQRVSEYFADLFKGVK